MDGCRSVVYVVSFAVAVVPSCTCLTPLLTGSILPFEIADRSLKMKPGVAASLLASIWININLFTSVVLREENTGFCHV